MHQDKINWFKQDVPLKALQEKGARARNWQLIPKEISETNKQTKDKKRKEKWFKLMDNYKSKIHNKHFLLSNQQSCWRVQFALEYALLLTTYISKSL